MSSGRNAGSFFRTQAHWVTAGWSSPAKQISKFNQEEGLISSYTAGAGNFLSELEVHFAFNGGSCTTKGLKMTFTDYRGNNKKIIKSKRFEEDPTNFKLLLGDTESVESMTLFYEYYYAAGFQINTNERNVLALPAGGARDYYIYSDDELDVPVAG